jgi:hypothetical protein
MPFQLNMLPTNADLLPLEGPMIAQVKLKWGPYPNYQASPSGMLPDGQGNFCVDINLQSQAQTGRFSRCQAVFIDNSTNAIAVTIRSQETGHVIYSPPFSQGMYNILCGQSPIMRATLLTGPQQFPATAIYPAAGSPYPPMGSTTFLFLNCPQKPFERNLLEVPSAAPGFTTNIVAVPSLPVAPATVVILDTSAAWSANYALILFRIDLSGVYTVGALGGGGTGFGINVYTPTNSTLIFSYQYILPAQGVSSSFVAPYAYSFVFPCPFIVPPPDNSGARNADTLNMHLNSTPNAPYTMAGVFTVHYAALPVN